MLSRGAAAQPFDTGQLIVRLAAATSGGHADPHPGHTSTLTALAAEKADDLPSRPSPGSKPNQGTDQAHQGVNHSPMRKTWEV